MKLKYPFAGIVAALILVGCGESPRSGSDLDRSISSRPAPSEESKQDAQHASKHPLPGNDTTAKVQPLPPPVPGPQQQQAMNEPKPPTGITPPAPVESKSQFVAVVEEKLPKLDQQIAELTKKTEELQGAAKAKADRTMESVRVKREEVGEKLDQLKQAGEQLLPKTMSLVKAALTELEEAVEEAKASIS